MDETNSTANGSRGHELQVFEHVHSMQFYNSGQLPAPRWAYIASGAYITAISVFAALGNSGLLWALTCSSALRSPSNLLIANLAFADLGLSVASFPLLFVSSFAGRWLFGAAGCNYYVVSVGFFGFVSITSMAVIAIDRCGSITRWSTWGLSYRKAFFVITLTWLISFALILPPLFGWSRFVLEGIQTSCTFDFFTRSPAASAYAGYLLVWGYAVPLTIIGVCYVAIVRHLASHRRLMTQSGFAVNGEALIRVRTWTNSSLADGRPRRDPRALETDIKASITCAIIVALFLIAWTPYAVTALIGMFGDQSLLTPIVNTLPAFFAKTSAVYNPIVYALMNDKFRQAIRSLIRHQNAKACTYREVTQIRSISCNQRPASVSVKKVNLRESRLRSNDSAGISDLQALSQARRDTATSVRNLSPVSLTTPIQEGTDGVSRGKLHFFANMTEFGRMSPGYFYEESAPGLKYGKFHSSNSLTGYHPDLNEELIDRD